jgi:TPR repeat protein
MEEIEKRYRFIFLKDINEKKIIDLFKHDIIGENNNDVYWTYVGLYYWRKIKDYDLMKKYYLMAIEYGNDKAMFYLGCYYEGVEENYDLMKKYYLMAIECGNDKAMFYLGKYYDKKGVTYDDIELIIKYHLDVNINYNIKIILSDKFISDNYTYLHKYYKNYLYSYYTCKYHDNQKYIDMINLVYCD